VLDVLLAFPDPFLTLIGDLSADRAFCQGYCLPDRQSIRSEAEIFFHGNRYPSKIRA
jgi:hypothetical protein